jgi:hypothetical protein
MKMLSYSLAALLVAASSLPASAQRLSSMHAFGGGFAHPSGTVRMFHPGVSLTAPATTPFDQQMQQSSATQLQQTQHDLLQQNPSGLTRSEISVGNDLNGYTSTLR